MNWRQDGFIWSSMLKTLVCGLMLACACSGAVDLLYANQTDNGEQKPVLEVLSKLNNDLTDQDKIRLIKAVESYRFGEYSAAIQSLKALKQNYPSNYDIISTLALAYEEAEDINNAIAAFRIWIKIFPADRGGAIGLGRVLSENGQHAESAQVFNRWANRHPEDSEMLILATQQFILASQFVKARVSTQRIMEAPDLSPDGEAAAHYFLVYLALLEGEIREAEAEAVLVAEASSDSPYKAQAAALIEQARKDRDGLHGVISIGSYHTSNAALLPDPIRKNALLSIGQSVKVADTALQSDLTLSYRRGEKVFSFDIGSTNYMTRSDLNLLRQQLSFGWEYGAWQFMPKYERAYFGERFLYQGGGLDIIWKLGNWNIQYSGMAKAYNSNFSTGATSVSLSRFSGLSSDINAQYMYRTDIFGYMTYLSAALSGHEELTRGDATHPESDSYRQLGSLLSLRSSLNLVNLSLAVNGYYRLYKNADPTVLAAGDLSKRRDRFIQLSGSLDFPMLFETPLALSLYSQWQKNISNYTQPLVLSSSNINSFQAWRLGGSLQWIF